ncbi:MAG TPA: Xaa-Pro peptidase family protein [Ktedonobacteraceae bacterium]|nr:Xaa-Pro peptidase family protein [Ktedonobacteraceae bacterium]
MPDNNVYPRFSAVEFARRYAALRATMQKAGLSALIVSGTVSSYNEIAYLSNFLVTREAMLVFPLEGDPALFVQMYNHVPTARQMACISDVRWGGPDTSVTAAGNVLERGFGESRIGLVGAISYKQYETLRRLLPGAALVDFMPQFIQLRLIKSDEEIEFLRKGAQFSDLAMQALENEARPGITEHQLTAIVEKAYLGLGGRTHIHYMATTSMRNPAVCVPAQHQSDRVIENGDVLLTEISAHYHSYPGQILRPFAIGTPPTPQYRHMYDVASEAFHRIASVIRPGATIDDLLDAAEYIHSAGFTIYDDLLHGFGGGYLPPVLRTRRTSPQPPAPFIFQENMTLVIQPNVITADERMGVQVGELVLITHDGIESLHHYPLRFVLCAQ